jgi:hypothetical protein
MSISDGTECHVPSSYPPNVLHRFVAVNGPATPLANAGFNLAGYERVKTQERDELQNHRRQYRTARGGDEFTIEDVMGENDVLMDPEETQLLPEDHVVLNIHFCPRSHMKYQHCNVK